MFKTVLLLAGLAVIATTIVVALHQQCPLRSHGPNWVVLATRSDIAALNSAAAFHRLDTGRYPSALPDLVDKGYLDRLPRDPWSSPYAIRLLEGGRAIDVYSLGPNRIDEAGSGDDMVREGKIYECPQYFRCPTLCERANNAAILASVAGWLGAIILGLVWAMLRAVGALRKRRS